MSECTYKADGQLMCKKKEEEQKRQHHVTIPKETFWEFDDSPLLVLGPNKLQSQGGVNTLNPGNRMFSIHVTDNRTRWFLYFNPYNYALECRLYPQTWVIYWRVSPWAKGGYPKYAKLHTNGKFALYASKKPDGKDEFEYWSTEKTGPENTVYTLDLMYSIMPRIIDSNGKLLWRG